MNWQSLITNGAFTAVIALISAVIVALISRRSSTRAINDSAISTIDYLNKQLAMERAARDGERAKLEKRTEVLEQAAHAENVSHATERDELINRINQLDAETKFLRGGVARLVHQLRSLSISPVFDPDKDLPA